MKEQILELLARCPEETLSGSKIATELGVTRAAVWKGIQQLREEGYQIEAGTNRGYRLAGVDQPFSKGEISRWLTDPLLGRELELLETVDSTNSLAKRQAQAGALEGKVFLAREQTQPRGRYGRPFFIQKGRGLYMSMILRPQSLQEQGVFLTACAAVAVCRALEQVAGFSPQIKWVNDIYYQSRKLCGILTEASFDLESGRPEYVVLGVGLNLSIRREDFPSQLQEIAASAEDYAPKPFSKSRLAAEILNQFGSFYRSFPAMEFLEEYQSRSCVVGRRVAFLKEDQRFEGIAVEIDSQARLVVQTAGGERFALRSGEVHILPEHL